MRKVTEESFKPKKRIEPDDDYLSRTIIDHPQLPFPMNINAPQPSLYKPSPEPGREQATGSPSPHRRRATLPSIALSPAEASVITNQWMKEDKQIEEEHSHIRTPSPLIGLAITSNVSQKRRSRSADHLHAVAAQQELAEIRRRSAEIQDWRSIQPGVAEVEDTEDVLPESRRDSVQDIKEIIPSISNHSSTSHRHLAPSVRHSGSTVTTDLEDSRRASKQDVEAISRVDQRLSQIEINMAQLAFSMHTISERETKATVPPPFRLGRVPKGQRTQQQDLRSRTTSGLPASPRDVGRATSVRDVAEGKKAQQPRSSPSYNDSHTQRNTQDPYGYQMTSPSFMQPLGITNLGREAASSSSTPQAQIHNFSNPFSQGYSQIPHSPTQPQSPGNMLEHLAPLYTALRYERTERKRLEALVLQLQRDLLDLTTIVAQRLGYADGYSPANTQQVLGGIRKGNTNQSSGVRRQQMDHHVMNPVRQRHDEVDARDEKDNSGEQGWEDVEDGGVGGDEMF
jgi:hypothetical protein